QRQRNVFGGGEGGQEVVLLEDESQVLPTEEHATTALEPVQRFAQDVEFPIGGVEQSRDDRQERSLPAAARSDQVSHLTNRNVECDATEHERLRPAIAELLANVSTVHGYMAIRRRGVAAPDRRLRAQVVGTPREQGGQEPKLPARVPVLSTSKDHRRLEHYDAPDTEEACHDHDEQDER